AAFWGLNSGELGPCSFAVGIPAQLGQGDMTYRHIGPILMSRPDVLKLGVPGRGWRESAIVGVGLLRIGPNSGVISQHEGLLAVIDDCEEIGVGLERVLAGQQARGVRV